MTIILLCQTPHFLGMMSITPRMKHSRSNTDLKYKIKVKLESKLLVWLAIGHKGMTRPLIKQSGYSVNKNTYKKHCIEKF